VLGAKIKHDGPYQRDLSRELFMRPKILKMFNTHAGWWFGTFFFFHSVKKIIIPTDELIFFRGVETTNQHVSSVSFLAWIHHHVDCCIRGQWFTAKPSDQSAVNEI